MSFKNKINIFDGLLLLFYLAWWKMSNIFNSNIKGELHAVQGKIGIYVICIYYIMMLYYLIAVFMMIMLILCFMFKLLILSQFAIVNGGEYPIVIERVLEHFNKFATDPHRLMFQVGVVFVLLAYTFIAVMVITDEKQEKTILLNQVKIIISTSLTLALILNVGFIAWLWFS